MSSIVEKHVCMAETRARRLEELAAEQGATEDRLIEEGLDLLFMKHANRSETEEDEEDDWQLLARLEAVNGPVHHNTRPIHRIDRDQIVSIVGTPIESRSHRQSTNEAASQEYTSGNPRRRTATSWFLDGIH